MYNLLCLFFSIFLISGCARGRSLNAPDDIGIMPFSEKNEPLSVYAHDVLVAEVERSPFLKVSTVAKFSPEFLQEMGSPHEGNHGPVDFDNSEEGLKRRTRLQHLLGANMLIFGSLFSDEENIYLYLQIMDLRTGVLLSNFSKEEKISGDINMAVLKGAKKLGGRVINYFEKHSNLFE